MACGIAREKSTSEFIGHPRGCLKNKGWIVLAPSWVLLLGKLLSALLPGDCWRRAEFLVLVMLTFLRFMGRIGIVLTLTVMYYTVIFFVSLDVFNVLEISVAIMWVA